MTPTWNRVVVAVTLSWLVVSSSAIGDDNNQDNALTFFAWSDQHVQTDGNGEHLIPAIDAMNSLPGTAYPDALGGAVAKPVFVFGLGDITEWPTQAAKNTYEQLITKRLKFPSFDLAGNHDLGGLSPSDTVVNWLIHRHKSLRYTFEKSGVTFIALFSEYDETLNNPAQPISKQALDYLRKILAKVPKGKPVVVATHLCFDAITNRDEFVDALGGENVILVLGGHYHKAVVSQYRGINFVQCPSPEPKSAGEFTVLRITETHLTAIPFNYRENRWAQEKGKILNIPIKGPTKKLVQEQLSETGK